VRHHPARAVSPKLTVVFVFDNMTARDSKSWAKNNSPLPIFSVSDPRILWSNRTFQISQGRQIGGSHSRPAIIIQDLGHGYESYGE
jgi:hypothetical protein